MSGTGVKISALPSLPTRPTGTEPVVLVRDGVTYRAPSDYLDNLAPSLPYATPLTGDEILGFEQGGDAVLGTGNDILRLSASRHTGLTFDNVAQAIAQVASLSVPLGSIITTANYAAVGDFGGGTYVRVAEQPTTHSGWFQDSAGVYWELWADTYRPEQFGGWSGGVTGSDTAAILAAMTMATLAGRAAKVAFVAGRRYRSGSVPIPNIPTAGNGAYLQIASDGWSFIDAIDEGDPEYLWAPSFWVDNSAFGSRKLVMTGLYFDAKSLKDYAFVARGTYWNIFNCDFRGANVAGCLHTNKRRDGTGTGSVGIFFWNCEFRQNNGDGFIADDTSVDYQVIRCSFSSNQGWGCDFQGTAGAQINSISSSGNNIGGLAGCARFDSWGWQALCSDSIFDGTSRGDVLVRSTSLWTASWGPNNNVKNANLVCEGLNPVLRLDDIQMQGDTSRIIANNGAGPTRKLLINGGQSAANPFLVFGTAGYAGVVFVTAEHYNQTVDGWYLGRQPPMDPAITDGYAPNIIRPGGIRLSESGTTVFDISLTVPAESMAGSFVTINLDLGELAVPVEPALSDIHAAAATIRARFTRRFASSTNKSAAEVVWQDGVPDGITVAAQWIITPATGTMTPVLRVTVTHPPPITTTSFVYFDIQATHRSVTAMTFSVAA